MVKTDKKTIEELIRRGVTETIETEHLEKSLAKGTFLRIKFGVDPTAPEIHLGHAVPLRKLRQFQLAGHQAILIIGDFTAQIGDPTGREEARRPMTEKEVKNNLKKYLKQAGKIIDLKNTEIYYNSRWFKKGLKVFLELARSTSIKQVLRRADFKKRMEGEQDISLLEVLYPLFQGYDSVAVKADIEIGGTDQTFNLLMGRQVQRHFNQKEQDIITLPLLRGLDGVRKMSKSFKNYIALDEEPKGMFSKIMSISDDLIEEYTALLTDISLSEIKTLPPYQAKINLAHEIVKNLHGIKKADLAKESFINVFQKKEMPEDVLVIESKTGEKLTDLILKSRLVLSKSELRRLFSGGAIFAINENEKITDYNYIIKKPLDLKIGKHRFLKIKIV